MLYNFFKKILHIIIYSSSLTYGYSTTQNTQHYYTFTYIINHPSLGPVDGTSIFTVLVLKEKISAINLATGDKVSIKDLPYIHILLEAIKKESNIDTVLYDKNNFPKKITSNVSPHILEAGFSIDILNHKTVANNYTLESQKLRIAYFQQNYQKWLALKKNTYSIAYQDKAFEDIYIDGLKVGVKNNKISTLEDIFSIKQVNLSEKEKVKTINQLFKFIKRRINKKNKLTLLYDIQYGYPYYIKNKADKIEIFLHNLN